MEFLKIHTSHIWGYGSVRVSRFTDITDLIVTRAVSAVAKRLLSVLQVISC